MLCQSASTKLLCTTQHRKSVVDGTENRKCLFRIKWYFKVRWRFCNSDLIDLFPAFISYTKFSGNQIQSEWINAINKCMLLKRTSNINAIEQVICCRWNFVHGQINTNKCQGSWVPSKFSFMKTPRRINNIRLHKENSRKESIGNLKQ